MTKKQGSVGQSKSSSSAYIPANNWNKRLAELKNHIWKQSNISLMFPEIKRFPEISDLPPTRIKEVFYHLRTWMNIWWKRLGEPNIAFQKQSKVRCNKSKSKWTFQIIVPSSRQRFYTFELTQHLMTGLREPRYYFRKWVNVHRAILESKIHSESLIPP